MARARGITLTGAPATTDLHITAVLATGIGPDLLTAALRRTVTLAAGITGLFVPRVGSDPASVEAEASMRAPAAAGN